MKISRLLIVTMCMILSLAARADQESSEKNAPQMKRAHQVEFEEVKTNANQTAAVALLTYADGAKSRCRYVMGYQSV